MLPSLDWWTDLLFKLLNPITASLAVAAIYYAFGWLLRAFQAQKFATRALKAVARREQAGLWVEGPGFWLKTPIVRPSNYDLLMKASIPILMIATLKGGVGKTTLAGSLAAHFAMRCLNANRGPLRVLVLDLDFQGSLSTMTVADDKRFAQPSKANQLVSGDLRSGLVRSVAEPIGRPGMRMPLTIATIPAYYDLAQAENRAQIEWLLPLSNRDLIGRLLRLLRLRAQDAPRSHQDVRYLLAEALLDPQVQANFDGAIVDAPPRLTTSHVQAMCASTHLLVPTILDSLSGDAVARYIDQVGTHKLGPEGEAGSSICPHLKPLGVICTLVPNNARNLDGDLNLLVQRLEIPRLKTHVLPQDCFIRQRPPYRECAGELIAYASQSDAKEYRDLRDEVDRLGCNIADKIGGTGRGWTYREAP
jgi:chromosome partitioning protein